MTFHLLLVKLQGITPFLRPGSMHQDPSPSKDPSSILRQALDANPSLVKAGSEKDEWINKTLLGKSPVESISPEYINTVAAVLALPQINNKKRVSEVSKIFSTALDTIEAHTWKNITGAFFSAAPVIENLPYVDVINLTKLFLYIAENSSQNSLSFCSTEQLKSITCESIPEWIAVARLHETAPSIVGKEHSEGIIRLLLLALATDESVTPAKLFESTILSSSLPESLKIALLTHKEKINPEAWKVDEKVLTESALLIKIVEILPSLTAHSEQKYDELHQSICREVVSSFGTASQLHSLVQRASKLSPHSAVMSALEKYSRGVPIPTIDRLVKSANESELPLHEFPTNLESLPAEFLVWVTHKSIDKKSRWVKSPEESLKRTSDEVRELISALSHFSSNSPFYSDLPIRIFDALHDGSDPTAHVPWNAELIALISLEYNQKQRSNNKETPSEDFTFEGFSNGEKRKFSPEFQGILTRYIQAESLASSLFKAGCSRPEAAKRAWRLSEYPDLQDTLGALTLSSKFAEDSINAVKDIAKDSSRTYSELERFLSALASIEPELWEATYKISTSVPAESALSISRKEFRMLLGATEDPTGDHLSEIFTKETTKKFVTLTRKQLLTYLFHTDEIERTKARDWLGSANGYGNDSGPWPLYLAGRGKNLHPEYVKMRRDVFSIYKGAFDIHYGFGRSTFECKTTPGTSQWMLTRFALDTATHVSTLHVNSSTKYPGKGIIISGLKPERIFVSNKETPNDPFSKYKIAWPWLKNEFDDLSRSHLLLSRGVKIITGPKEKKYVIDGVHYSLVAWNDHFENPELYGAALVPTSIISGILTGKTSSISSLDTVSSVNEQLLLSSFALTPQFIKDRCAAKGLPFLNLTWASNINGVCNAYPPRSAPYFLWEESAPQSHSDADGHIHKSVITGSFEYILSREADILLRPMREAHAKVVGTASAYFNIYDLFRLGKAIWHKGQSVRDESTEVLTHTTSHQSHETPDVGENEFRMLLEAFKWNKFPSKDLHDFPILAITPTLDDWSMVKSPILLDTYSMALTLPDGRVVQLNPKTHGGSAFDISMWVREVRPLYHNRSDLDLQFLDRRDVQHVSE
jgi:hypothetical protein